MKKEYTDKELNFFGELESEIRTENSFQLRKWGKQTHNLPEWMLILNEEVGELNKAVLEQELQGIEGIVTIRTEAIQVATLALKIAEMIKDE